MEFADILKKTMKWEGGFVNDPDDKGGATKFGITLSTLKSLKLDINNDGKIDIDDVHALTKERAATIYEEQYYLYPNFHLLPDATQPVVFDMGVNHGQRRAGKILQHVINLSGFAQIDEDGIVGKMTASKAQLVYQRMGHYFINAICDERLAFYQRIVANNPTQQKFLSGWSNRANDFKIHLT